MVGEKLVDLWGMILKDDRFQKMELRLERVWFFSLFSIINDIRDEFSFHGCILDSGRWAWDG